MCKLDSDQHKISFKYRTCWSKEFENLYTERASDSLNRESVILGNIEKIKKNILKIIKILIRKN